MIITIIIVIGFSSYYKLTSARSEPTSQMADCIVGVGDVVLCDYNYSDSDLILTSHYNYYYSYLILTSARSEPTSQIAIAS